MPFATLHLFIFKITCYVDRLRTPSIADAIFIYYSKRLEDISFALWVLISRVQRHAGEGRRGAPLKGSRREKSLLAIEVGTPRIESLGGESNPLEVAVPVRIFILLIAKLMPNLKPRRKIATTQYK